MDTGFLLESAEGVLVRNFIIQNFSIGIRLNGSSKNKIIKNSTIENTMGIAIFPKTAPPVADSTENIIAYNLCKNNNTGIALFSIGQLSVKDNIIQYNWVTKNADFGLILDGSDVQKNLIKKNKATDNRRGITLVDASGNTVKLNRFSRNRVNGIRLEASAMKNQIKGNKANNNGGDGIVLDANTIENVIEKNKAFGNSIFDIREEGTNTFIDNKCGTSSGEVDCLH